MWKEINAFICALYFITFTTNFDDHSGTYHFPTLLAALGYRSKLMPYLTLC